MMQYYTKATLDNMILAKTVTFISIAQQQDLSSRK